MVAPAMTIPAAGRCRRTVPRPVSRARLRGVAVDELSPSNRAVTGIPRLGPKTFTAEWPTKEMATMGTTSHQRA